MSLLPADDVEFSLETRHTQPSHLLTKIKCFSKLSKHGISELELMEFEAGDHKWKLIIYPDGDEVGKNANVISVKLSMVGTSSLPACWEVTAVFNFFLYNYNSDNYLCFRGKARRLHAMNPEMRFSKVIDKTTFTEPSNGYVFNDNCIFGGEVFVIKNKQFVESTVSLLDDQPYEREWEISDFSENGYAWSSEDFFAGGYNWNINLYLNGNTGANGRCISIFLHCIDSKSFASHKKVKATCVFTLTNKLRDEEGHSKGASHWFTSSVQSWDFPKFKAINDMHDEVFVLKDCYLLEIRLSVEAIQEALS